MHKIFKLEVIRIGTVELMKGLKMDGHKIYIYTTSLRSTTKIWCTFIIYGIRLDKVINQKIHDKTLREQAKSFSKYPPAFNIDIHVDDSKGVAIEDERHRFKTIVVSENDLKWTETILLKIKSDSLH
ncbi:MAG: hypothetical protein QM802_16280 [Agriterribacter sp.]